MTGQHLESDRAEPACRAGTSAGAEVTYATQAPDGELLSLRIRPA